MHAVDLRRESGGIMPRRGGYLRGQTIGDRLRQVREDRGLSQQEMASKLNIPFGTYQGYEQDRNGHKAEVLARLREYDVDLNWLIAGSGRMYSDENSTSRRAKVDDDLLTVVVSEVEHLLTERGSILSPGKKAELIVLVYDLAQSEREQGRQLNRGNIVRLVKLAG